MLGTYQAHWQWASWAALGVILSACYLLWSYQRVFFGEVIHEKNKTLPDASRREKFILMTLSLVMLWMGIGSTYFTRRTAAAAQTVIDQVEPQRPYEAGAPSKIAPAIVARDAKSGLRNSKQNSAAASVNR